jgi:RNase adaptor protein for sRNA GlmZ degradation
MKKHTSVYLSEDLQAKIEKTGKPLNAVVTEALNSYFSGSANKDLVQEEVKKYLQSEEMQKFYLREMYKLLVPLLESIIPSTARKDIYRKLEPIING